MSADASAPTVGIVIPTVGRSCLAELVGDLEREAGVAALAGAVALRIVDDRPDDPSPLPVPQNVFEPVVLRTGARGPAAARNTGWRHLSGGGGAPEWIVFVDDDVRLDRGWWDALRHDIEQASPGVAAVQARLDVPLPTDRPPTDRERDVAGLASAAWITADMAVRTSALLEVDGFDERFRRAYREDTDLALRLRRAGWVLARGTRGVRHPVRPAPWWASVSAQRGNADDALMARLHGPHWRRLGDAPAGLLPVHVVATATLAGAVLAASFGRRRTATAAAAAWAGSWWAFWRHRRHAGIAPVDDLAVAATSAAIPPAAVFWAALGRVRAAASGPIRAGTRS